MSRVLMGGRRRTDGQIQEDRKPVVFHLLQEHEAGGQSRYLLVSSAAGKEKGNSRTLFQYQGPWAVGQ